MHDKTEALQQAIEQPRDVTFWGETYRVVPAFIDEVFGDGRKLAYVEPFNSRPFYYVVRVDSAWSPKNDGGRPTLGQMSGAILEAARERWGESWPEDEPERKNGRPWPAVATDDGCSYGILDWPAGFEPEPDAGDALIAILADRSKLAELEPYEWRRIAQAAIDSLELHLDPRSEAARAGACRAAFATLPGWRRREDEGLAEALFGGRMGDALDAALAFDTFPRRLRLTGVPDSHVIEMMLIKEYSIFEAPKGLGLSEIVALQTIASGVAPAYRVYGRSEAGLVPLRVVDGASNLDSAAKPWRFSPGTIETIPYLRVREDGVLTKVPCTGFVFREQEVPEDEALRAAVMEMRGISTAPEAAGYDTRGPAAG